MINKIKEFIKEKKIYIYCLTLAFLILLFTSKNSFLYPLNDWMDANAFFTVGKSMFNGVVPYKDLFEQKGLLLYVIYGIGYLISKKTFYGIFILEVLFFSVFLYYVYKIVSLFFNKKYSYILIPLIGMLISTSLGFVHGGSCEEFCLPMFAITLYYFFRFYTKNDLNNKDYLIAGIMAGCIFMIKYTLLGFCFGFAFFIFMRLLLKKQIKKAFLMAFMYLLGMFIPIGLSLIYLGLNGAINDFIDAYFTINMTAYNREKTSILMKIGAIYKGFYKTLLNNGMIIFILIILIPVWLIKIKVSKYAKVSIIGMLLLSILGLYWGLRFYNYYIVPIFVFLIVSLVGLASLFTKYLDKIVGFKYSNIVYGFIFFGVIGLCYWKANYKDMILMDKDDLFQYRYADYIDEFDNPTLLNMGYLDAGLYTTTGIVPNTKFFEVQNIPYDKFPDNLDDMKYNVENKNVMFILYYTKKDLDYLKENEAYIFENYELVFDDNQLCEKDYYNAFLFKVKGYSV